VKKSELLILHIGNHKTGTTSIQKAMVQEERFLRDNGYTVFRQGTKNNYLKYGNLSGWVQYMNNEFSVPHAVMFANLLHESGNKVIASGEGFSWLINEAEVNNLVLELKKVFNEVVVICYLRRQDKQVFSHYLQSSKDRTAVESRVFGSEIASVPSMNSNIDAYLDYYKRMMVWNGLLCEPPHKLIVKNFERKLLQEEDIVCDFFSLLGLTYNGPLIQTNISPSIEQSVVGHLCNGLNISASNQRAIFRGLSSNNTPTISRETAGEIMDIYKDSNISLFQKFGISFEELIVEDDLKVNSIDNFDVNVLVKIFTMLEPMLSITEGEYNEILGQSSSKNINKKIQKILKFMKPWKYK